MRAIQATVGMAVVALGSVLALGACGGGGSRPAASEPTDETGEAAKRPDGPGVDPEVFDELTRTFNKKRGLVARCYSSAVESGKLDKKAKGRISVQVSITADGTPKGVKATQDTLRSPEVTSCVTDMIATWQLPEPGDTCEFSFSYDFEPE